MKRDDFFAAKKAIKRKKIAFLSPKRRSNAKRSLFCGQKGGQTQKGSFFAAKKAIKRKKVVFLSPKRVTPPKLTAFWSDKACFVIHG
ncbi:MAG TPA: hypothetical protein P5526_20085 [Anaerolineae bacterium]|nr:hypothetical protein [Anaerolineae bacterium]HRV94468.1 hypothetical protein [Anaerolineae bacterium]